MAGQTLTQLTVLGQNIKITFDDQHLVELSRNLVAFLAETQTTEKLQERLSAIKKAILDKIDEDKEGMLTAELLKRGLAELWSSLDELEAVTKDDIFKALMELNQTEPPDDSKLKNFLSPADSDDDTSFSQQRQQTLYRTLFALFQLYCDGCWENIENLQTPGFFGSTHTSMDFSAFTQKLDEKPTAGELSNIKKLWAEIKKGDAIHQKIGKKRATSWSLPSRVTRAYQARIAKTQTTTHKIPEPSIPKVPQLRAVVAKKLSPSQQSTSVDESTARQTRAQWVANLKRLEGPKTDWVDDHPQLRFFWRKVLDIVSNCKLSTWWYGEENTSKQFRQIDFKNGIGDDDTQTIFSSLSALNGKLFFGSALFTGTERKAGIVTIGDLKTQAKKLGLVVSMLARTEPYSGGEKIKVDGESMIADQADLNAATKGDTQIKHCIAQTKDHTLIDTDTGRFHTIYSKTIRIAVFQMYKNLNEGKDVYVHCSAGKKRSKIMVLCLLIRMLVELENKNSGTALEQALKIVKRDRPEAKPWSQFRPEQKAFLKAWAEIPADEQLLTTDPTQKHTPSSDLIPATQSA